jgi:hypothetical protein
MQESADKAYCITKKFSSPASSSPLLLYKFSQFYSHGTVSLTEQVRIYAKTEEKYMTA